MMNTLELLTAIVLLVAAGLVLGWVIERRHLRAFYARTPRLRWSEKWSVPDGGAATLDAEWRELDYQPLGILLTEDEPGSRTAVYRHPTLPIYGLSTTRGTSSVACAMTFWEGGGTLITTAAPVREAHALAVETGSPRLVQLRVGGRPLALDGQHSGTVRAWALGKRSALPATQEALIPYLANDYNQARTAVEQGNPVPFSAYVRLLAGRPQRILTF